MFKAKPQTTSNQETLSAVHLRATLVSPIVGMSMFSRSVQVTILVKLTPGVLAAGAEGTKGEIESSNQIDNLLLESAVKGDFI